MKSLVSVENQYFIKLDQKYDDFATFKSSIDNQLNDLLQRYLNIKTKVQSIQKILKKATCKEDLDEIQNQLTDVKDLYFKKIDLNSEEYEALITRTEKILRQHLDKPDDNGKLDPKIYFGAMKKSIDEEICRYLDQISNINFPLPSDDIKVKKRLGCTEHCYWCGALCWKAWDHQVEKEKTPEMERHHSCHQPSGLNGSKDPDSEELCAVSCHNYLDTTRVWFKEFKEGEGMLWSDAKRDHFSDWKFDAHCITTYDEMMRWFFQELHEDIATRLGFKPAGTKELQANKCENLNLEEILKVVHSKI